MDEPSIGSRFIKGISLNETTLINLFSKYLTSRKERLNILILGSYRAQNSLDDLVKFKTFPIYLP